MLLLFASSEGCFSPWGRANPVWLDPFCRNMELAAQAEHEDDLPENLSEITDLWNSPARTHVRHGSHRGASSPRPTPSSPPQPLSPPTGDLRERALGGQARGRPLPAGSHPGVRQHCQAGADHAGGTHQGEW